MIELRGLSVTYPDRTVGLKNVNCHLEPGETCGLIGSNGAGKTSLLLALVGVVPAQGSGTLAGLQLEPKNLRNLRQKVGLVFQNPDDQLFLPTIYQDVAFGLENMGVATQEVRPRVERCLEKLGILHLKDRSALRLSGGEKRMAALATVLVMEPEILLLDEPTAFLDSRARRRLIEALGGLPQTMLIATHDLAFARETCKRTLVLLEGQVFADGPSETLIFDRETLEQAGIEALERTN